MQGVRRVLSGVVIGWLMLWGVGVGAARLAPLSQNPVWAVTYPAEGSTVSGVVTIIGTATHPNFGSYSLYYAAGPRAEANSQWVPIVVGVPSMVVNGPLATWDTTALPPGPYTLYLLVYEAGRTDVGNNFVFVNNIKVENAVATPTPEATATPQPLPTPVGTLTGPVVVPTVEQPPTVTPRPTATLLPGETPRATGTPTGGLAALSLQTLKEAACSGVWIAFLIYLLWGLYLLAKLAWRYSQRKPRG